MLEQLMIFSMMLDFIKSSALFGSIAAGVGVAAVLISSAVRSMMPWKALRQEAETDDEQT